MIKQLTELLSAAGLTSISDIRPEHINQRTNTNQVANFSEIYSFIGKNCLLSDLTRPVSWQRDWQQADANSW
jgi:hypothetical protein